MQCMFCRLQLDELVRRELVATKEDLRIPRNSNNFETLDDFQLQKASFLNSHSPVPSRRPSLIRLWWFVYGIVDIHLRILDLLDPSAVSVGNPEGFG